MKKLNIIIALTVFFGYGAQAAAADPHRAKVDQLMADYMPQQELYEKFKQASDPGYSEQNKKLADLVRKKYTCPFTGLETSLDTAAEQERKITFDRLYKDIGDIYAKDLSDADIEDFAKVLGNLMAPPKQAEFLKSKRGQELNKRVSAANEKIDTLTAQYSTQLTFGMQTRAQQEINRYREADKTCKIPSFTKDH